MGVIVNYKVVDGGWVRVIVNYKVVDEGWWGLLLDEQFTGLK